MNEISSPVNNNKQITAPQEDQAAAKTLLLQQHASYLERVNRVTFTNRTLCLFGLIGGGLLQALLNVPSACFVFLGMAVLGGLWRVELSFVLFRLRTIEEGIVRTGGGPWEDEYIRIKHAGNGEPFDRALLWGEPIVWSLVSLFLLITNLLKPLP